MGQNNKAAVFAIVIILGIFLQVLLIKAESTDSPSRAAVKFTKAYFSINEDMSERLCSSIVGAEDSEVVADFIYNTTQQAAARGYHVKFLKQSLSHIHAQVLERTDSTADIHLTAKRRTGINPVFTWVATLFDLGEVHELDAHLEMVREDGKWKVCGAPFSLLAER